MNVGIACYDSFGGSGTVASEMGYYLASQGHQVHFISFGVPVRLRCSDNIFVHEVRVPHYPLFRHPPMGVALASKMVDVCRSANLDILHVHYAVPLATSAYLAKQVLGDEAPKIVTTLHGTDITLVGNDPGYLPLTAFSIEKSDWVTAVSAYLKEETYLQLGIDRSKQIDVVMNFVDTEKFVPCDTFPQCRSPIPRLIHISNFRKVKRVPDVIEIFRKVVDKIDARLVLVGDGPTRPQVEDMVRRYELCPKVQFVGKQIEFIDTLNRSDIFLLPSEEESFGLSALEALSCGVPVVASNVGGVSELVTPEVGFLSEVGDVDSMASNCLELIEDRERLVMYRKQAREYALDNFDISSVAPQYMEGYRKVVGR